MENSRRFSGIRSHALETHYVFSFAMRNNGSLPPTPRPVLKAPDTSVVQMADPDLPMCSCCGKQIDTTPLARLPDELEVMLMTSTPGFRHHIPGYRDDGRTRIIPYVFELENRRVHRVCYKCWPVRFTDEEGKPMPQMLLQKIMTTKSS